MFRDTLRKLVIVALGGTIPDPKVDAPEEVEDPDEEVDEGEVITTMYMMGPDGPVPLETNGIAPPGMPSHIAKALGLRSAGARHIMSPEGRTDPGANPSRPPTMRTGPASASFSMRVIDCTAVMDPMGDPEVQFLLTAGWEPFGVHKFSSHTGAQGVRLYFKRAVGPSPVAES